MHSIPQFTLAAVFASIEKTLWKVNLLLHQFVNALPARHYELLGHIVHARLAQHLFLFGGEELIIHQLLLLEFCPRAVVSVVPGIHVVA